MEFVQAVNTSPEIYSEFLVPATAVIAGGVGPLFVVVQEDWQDLPSWSPIDSMVLRVLIPDTRWVLPLSGPCGFDFHIGGEQAVGEGTEAVHAEITASVDTEDRKRRQKADHGHRNCLTGHPVWRTQSASLTPFHQH